MASKKIKVYLINEYKDAIKRSPVWIRIAFKSFLQLPDKYVMNQTFLQFILGKGTDDFKMSKETAQYGLSEVSGQICSTCIYSYSNNVENKNICSHVRGEINPNKWCRFWSGLKK